MPGMSPDTFPQPYESTVASDRPTAPGVGGVRHPALEELHGKLPRRQNPTVNPRATAAAGRAIDQATPRSTRLRGTGTATTGQTLIIGLSGPMSGFEWNVRRVTVGPKDYAAGSFPTGVFVALAVSGERSTLSVQDSAYEVVSSTTSYPAEATWGNDEFQLVAGERMFILITGLTTGTFVTCGGQAYEYATQAPGINTTYEV